MSDQMLTLLKFGVLALLYIFFAWALWAVWSEVRSWRSSGASDPSGRDRPPVPAASVVAARPVAAAAVGAAPAPVEEPPPAPALIGTSARGATASAPAPASDAPPQSDELISAAAPAEATTPDQLPPGVLLVVAPPEQAGLRYPLGRELTIGRAAGCGVSIDDTFVSQLHARVYAAQNTWMVEDLQSTNGTIFNGNRLQQATVIRQGDQIQLGSTVLELR